MSDDKKDLTRIEDLGEYLHELELEDEIQDDPFSSDEPPLETPLSEEDPFGSSSDNEDEVPEFSSETSFKSTESEFPENSFDSDFSSVVSTYFNEDDPFSSETSTDDSTEDFETSFETSSTDTEKIDTEDPFAGVAEEEPFTEFETKTELPSLDFGTVEVEDEPAPIAEAPKVSEVYRSPENFSDLKKFAESSSFTGMGAEGNPSFSVLVKNVRYLEDVNDIIIQLKDLKLLVDDEEQIKSRLMRGQLLIPRISEYAAIFLAHKLRRFDIDIQVGLADEIHPPKHNEAPETGIVSKHSLYQNQSHHFEFDESKVDISQVIVSATSNLEGYQVLKYLGVASEHKMLESTVVEDEDAPEIPNLYSELAQKLKAHAIKANANAVVGLNYQLTPIPSELGGGHKYRLSCTGNLVLVNKL